jgi:hypothetical protein
MIAPQNQEQGLGESMADASIRRWYDSMKHAMDISEVRPGSYEYTMIDATTGTSPLTNDSKTSFRFQANRFQMISLDNSYILLKQEVSFEVDKHDDVFVKEYFVGYRDVAAVFGSYNIKTNNDELQTITNACYEWFLNDVSINDPAKESNDTFATLRKIRARNPNVPGEYIDVSKIATRRRITVELDLKIPLNRFLIFRNL